MELIVSLIAGVLGGNAAGAVLKPLNLGMRGNSLAGLAGGFLGGQMVLQTDSLTTFTSSSTGAAAVMAVLLAAAIGGFCLTLLGGLLRQATSRR